MKSWLLALILLLATSLVTSSALARASCAQFPGAAAGEGTLPRWHVDLQDAGGILEPEERAQYKWHLEQALGEAELVAAHPNLRPPGSPIFTVPVASASGEQAIPSGLVKSRTVRARLSHEACDSCQSPDEPILVTFSIESEDHVVEQVGHGDAFGREDLNRAGCVAAAEAMGMRDPGAFPVHLSGEGYGLSVGLTPWLREFTGALQLGLIDARSSRFRGGLELSLGAAHARRFEGLMQVSLWDNSAYEMFDGLAQIGIRENDAGTFRGLLQLALWQNTSNEGFALARLGALNLSGFGTELAGGAATSDGSFALLDLGLLANVSNRTWFEVLAVAPCNWSGGFLGGVQVGLFNYVHDAFHGGILELGVANMVRGGFRGTFQLGAVNLVGGFDGLVQVGAFNRAHVFAGAVQLGGVNRVAADVRGVQVALLANMAGALVGAEVGPLNVAHEVHGVQLGLVNIAGTLRGVQLGLVNLSRDGALRGSPLVNLGF